MKQKESYVMGKIFEDYFSEYQADMVSICLEYVDWRADAIYIYTAHMKVIRFMVIVFLKLLKKL